MTDARWPARAHALPCVAPDRWPGVAQQGPCATRRVSRMTFARGTHVISPSGHRGGMRGASPNSRRSVPRARVHGDT